MKQLLGIISLMVVSLSLCACSESADSYRKRAEALYPRIHSEPQALEEAIAILSEGITAYPENDQLLSVRATLLCNSGRGKECYADVLRLSALKPDFVENAMFLCLMEEAMGEAPAVNKACYQQVADMYEKKYQMPKATYDLNELNYVMALLMAENPLAEARKADYLRKADEDGDSWLQHEFLDTFTRQDFLRQLTRSLVAPENVESE